MNYEILEMDNDPRLFCVYESATNQVISEHDTYCDAKLEVRRLNLGGGFDGFTPSFILKKSANNCKNYGLAV